jgi:FAD/FMN-containing dehydrogenase
MVMESNGAVQSKGDREAGLGTLVTDPDVLEGYRRDASPVVGSPEGLLRPSSASEAAGWLQEAAGRGVAVTACGLRTSTTGAGLAPHGWTMSCERMVGLVDLDPERRIARVRPGTVLREFKDAVEDAGLFYPPDPTSERECAVGGTVACDASGARTYRYGATHRWVRAVEIAMVDGSVRRFQRPSVGKDAAGYAALRNLVDLVCGSEGTLGFITEVEVDLIARPEAFSAGLAFFLSLADALAFVAEARREDSAGTGVKPRCLELLDEGCLEIMRAQDTAISPPAAAGAAIFFEEEHAASDTAAMAVMEAWWALLERSPGSLADDTVIADAPARQAELRSLRHAVPATLNEEGRGYESDGGRKISTDWAVPFAELPAFMEAADRRLEAAGVERVFRYGHVGNGHPHYNLLVRDDDERRRADGVVEWMCEEACRRGGTITAEHGMGKVKLHYAHHRFDPLSREVMRAIKDRFDPKGILAPGNLFPI